MNWWRVFASIMLLLGIDFISDGYATNTHWMVFVGAIPITASVITIWERPGK